jgi:hypothetical protein
VHQSARRLAAPPAEAPVPTAAIAVGSRVVVSGPGEHCGKRGAVVGIDGPDVLVRLDGSGDGILTSSIEVLARSDVSLALVGAAGAASA